MASSEWQVVFLHGLSMAVLRMNYADLIVNNRVIVELKTKSAIHSIDKAQTLSHLRLPSKRVGLLINSHEVKLVEGVHEL